MSGWIEKRYNGRYRARYRLPDGSRPSKTFRTKAEARAWISTVEADLLRGEYVSSQAGNITLADWAEVNFFPTRFVRETTMARDDSVYRNHLKPVFGHLPLNKVTQPDVVLWVSIMAKNGYSPAFVQKAYQLLAKMMSTAVDADLLKKTPCRNVALPTIVQEEMRFLDVDDIWALAEAIDPRYRSLVLVACYAGLRIGELCGLQQRDVDPLRSTIEVRSTIAEVHGRIVRSEPKTRAGKRTVPVPHSIMAELTAHIAAHCTQGPYEPVFPAPQGGEMRPTGFRQRQWAPAVKKAGLAPLRCHDMRHTAVALWIAAGWRDKQIATWAGHRSVVTVLDRYGHLLPSEEEAAREQLERLAVRPSKRPNPVQQLPVTADTGS